MKSVCAWCHKEISSDGQDGSVSHGICRECLHKALNKQIGAFHDLFKGVNLPVLLLDRNGRVYAANRDTSEYMGSHLCSVFQCPLAIDDAFRDSGKCRKCTLIRLFRETCENNHFHSHQKVSLPLKGRQKKGLTDYRVTSWKSGDFVVLVLNPS